MNRREALQHVMWLMGGALSAQAVLDVLSGSKASARSQPGLLTEKQRAVVAEVADIILPRTDTPGAKDAGVPAFIETMLNDVYPAEDQQRYISGLTEFDARSNREHGRSFLELDLEQRTALLQTVHDAAVAAEQRLALPPYELRRPFVLMTKELTLLGFFTSEVGATQVLQYDPIPGGFRACIALSQAGNGKAWAVETSTRF